MKTKNVELELDELYNLCPVGNNSYRPVSAPRKLADEGWTPLCPLSEGRIVASQPGSLAVIDANPFQITPIGATTAQCAGMAAGGTLVAMSDAGPEMYDTDEAGDFAAGSGGIPDWSPIAITAEPTGAITVHTDAVELSREYNPGDTVTMADRSTLGTMLSRVYAEVCVQARTSGVFFEPLVARAVVRGRDGRVLHRGPHLLIMPPDGPAFDRAVSLPVTTKNAVDGSDISVAGYRLRVRVLPMASQQWCERAERIDIEVSPCFLAWRDTADNSAAEANMVRQGTSGLAMLVRMPGSEHCPAAFNTARNTRLVANMVAHFDSVSTVIASIAQPFDRGGDTVVTPDGMPGISAQTEALRTLNRTKSPAAADLTRHCLNAPHSFTAKLMSTIPAAMAYTGITPLLYPGYTPFDHVATFEDDVATWTAMTTVTYADGTTSRRFCQGVSAVPHSLNPLIAFPHPEARAIDIVLEDDRGGELPRCWHVALTPSPDGLHAIGLAEISTVRTPEIDTEAWLHDTTSQRRPQQNRSGLIAIAPANRPLDITTTVDLGLAVTAITAARSSAAAWDFGRTRFYAFTDRSTFLVNIASSLADASIGIISQTGVPGPGAVAADDTVNTYYIGGSRTIYRIDGSRVVRVADCLVDIDRLGFDRSTRTLVAGHSSGAGVLSHFDATTGALFTTTASPGPIDAMMSVGSSLLAPSQDGLLDVALGSRIPAEDERAAVAMRCSVRPDSAVRARKPAGVLWHIESSAFDGTLSVSRRYLSANRSARIAGYTVSGRLAAPVHMPLFARPSAGTCVEISALVSADTLIAKPYLS